MRVVATDIRLVKAWSITPCRRGPGKLILCRGLTHVWGI